MEYKEFSLILDDQINRIKQTLQSKGEEYSTDDDRLHNFKVAAEIQGITQEAALGGMLAKHIVSIYDLIARPYKDPMEVWDEKLTDAINYLILLRAVVAEERGYIPETKSGPRVFH